MTPNFSKLEEKILKFWQDQDIFNKLRTKNQGKKKWSFIDGPITANNSMGVHHAWGRTLKDFFQRYKALQGFDQRYQNGFDCQGLWVEVEVEKDLGFNSKRDIEKFGLHKFSRACSQRVKKYSQIQTKQSIRLGQWMDWDNSYFTLSETNNEYIWYFLKKCQARGWLYKGTNSVPWCARCGTAISQHELSDGGYTKLTHQAVYLKFPLIDEPETSLLVWTTTPWTLLANVAAAVHADMNYVKIRIKNSQGGTKSEAENLILAKDLLKIIAGDYEIIEKFKGQKLAGKKYQGPFDEIEVQKDVEHEIVLWDEVSAEEGTGIVHIAPGCGKEDHELAGQKKLAIIAPIDEFGDYYKGFGDFTGKNAAVVRDEVFSSLKSKNLLFRTENYTHSYPCCWRCKEELLFRVSTEWFISAKEIRILMKKAAAKVGWLPGFTGKRMQDWLDNMGDWPISRKRFWGLALPFYECSCGEVVVVGSRQELKKLAIDPAKVDELPELHRPWIDKIKIRCPKCSKEVERIPDVGDCWLDAGIVPFSTLKYLEDKKYWQEWFPAEFICESAPQIKLWYYSMLFMAVTLENTSPYKKVLSYLSVVDEKGQPMHKSDGNAIWFDEAVEKMGADVMRWLYLSGNVALNLKFGFKLGDETRRRLLTLWNVFSFYEMYVDKDLKSTAYTLQSSHILDKWILAKLNFLIKETTQILDSYYTYPACEKIENFIMELSTWYVRRSRVRFKSNDLVDKKQALATLHNVLMNLVKLMAPFTPFLTEELYQSLGGKKESVHLEEWPRADKKLINEVLIEQMTWVLRVVGLAHVARAEAGVKVRQPLANLTVDGVKLTPELLKLIKDEVNVLEVEVDKIKKAAGWQVKEDNNIKVALDTNLTAELKERGLARELVRHINLLRKKKGLTIKDKADLIYQTDSVEIKKVFEKYQEKFQSDTLTQKIKAGKVSENAEELKINKEIIRIELLFCARLL